MLFSYPGCGDLEQNFRMEGMDLLDSSDDVQMECSTVQLVARVNSDCSPVPQASPSHLGRYMQQ